jgi:hypothetical protein
LRSIPGPPPGPAGGGDSLSVYRAGTQVFTERQTTDWGAFLACATPGFTASDLGKGTLDPACHAVSFESATARCAKAWPGGR